MSDQEKDTSPGHSTGPRSANGKENSSQNAATHGLCCKKFFLIPGETEEEFLEHAQRWFDQYKEFSTPALESLLQDLAEAHWLQKRAMRRIFDSECALATAEMNRDPAADEIFRRLRNIQRYKTSYENSFQKALRSVEAFCKNRVAVQVSQSRAKHIVTTTQAVDIKSLERFIKMSDFTPEEIRKEVQKFCRSRLRIPQSEGPAS